MTVEDLYLERKGDPHVSTCHVGREFQYMFAVHRKWDDKDARSKSSSRDHRVPMDGL